MDSKDAIDPSVYILETTSPMAIGVGLCGPHRHTMLGNLDVAIHDMYH